MENAGLTVLVESETGGVHMAVSPDQFRMIYFQGHPEYDKNSLLKEYKRELMRYLSRELDVPPAVPENFFSASAMTLVEKYIDQVEQARSSCEPLTSKLEEDLETILDNTWGDTAKALVNNWLGLVYQVTNLDRTQQFMEDVDPHDPLGLKTQT